jgi:hypothetical protein
MPIGMSVRHAANDNAARAAVESVSRIHASHRQSGCENQIPRIQRWCAFFAATLALSACSASDGAPESRMRFRAMVPGLT